MALIKGSPKVKSGKKIDMFLYLLLRDSTTPIGELEKIVQTVETAECTAVFCNGFLAKYAQNIRKRLTQ